MRSTKSIILVVIALGCGLVASIGISQVMESQGDSGYTEDTLEIYVAATNVPGSTLLHPQLVKLESWPKNKIPPNAITDFAKVEGMRPLVPLYPGEPLVLTKLTDGKRGPASFRIPPDHQVMSVKVDKESVVSGLVLPGDKVDILVFIRGSGMKNSIATGTRTILRNISVFAVNDQIGRNPEGEETTIDAKTVSLLVTPEQSEKLLLAKQMGTLHLALRNPDDKSDVATKGASPGDLDESEGGTDFSGDDSIAANTGGNPPNGIFGILKEMNSSNPPPVDTSIAAGAGRTMVIMSREGVIGSYSFPAGAEKFALPPELTSLSPTTPVGSSEPAGGIGADLEFKDDVDGELDLGDEASSADLGL